jgi:ankyrin repeat protein
MRGNAKLIVVLSAASVIAAGHPAMAADSDHRIADAAERQERDAVRSLITLHADVNGAQPDGATALQWAAHWDDLDGLNLLLHAGANPNAANDNGVTALGLACENGNAAAAEALVQAGANVNAATIAGETVLMTASRAGNADVVRLLLAGGADVNAREASHGQTALMWAVAYGHPAAVKVLAESGADLTARSEIRNRMVHTGYRFGDRGADKGALRMDLGGFVPLLFAARQGEVESAAVLLAAGADVNVTAPNGASALAVAVLSGHRALATLLLEKGADAKAAGAGYAPIHAAVLHGDRVLVETLLAHGAGPDAQITRGTPSRYYSKDFAFNEALIGATPLWLAARYGDVEMLRLLAGRGADTRFAMKDGTTPLVAAIAANAGFGLGDRREQYVSPADAAARAEGDDEKVTLATASALVDLGADVNAGNQAGDTPLHLAAGQGLLSVAQLLAAHGADLEAKNKRGLTPLAVAIAPRQRGPFAQTGPDPRIPVAQLLRKLGAKEPPPMPAPTTPDRPPRD